MVPNIQPNRIAGDEDERQRHGLPNDPNLQDLRIAARELAASLRWLPRTMVSETFKERCQKLAADLASITGAVDAASRRAPNSEGLLWLRDNSPQLVSETQIVTADLAQAARVPHVISHDTIVPRVLAIAETFIDKCGTTSCKSEFTAFCAAFEETTPLEFHEIGALVPSLKLVLLETIAAQGIGLLNDPAGKSSESVVPHIRTLEHVTRTSWKDELEGLIPFDRILRQDPARAYASMDIESRTRYRDRISEIALGSERAELEVAQEALGLAREARERRYSDPRIQLRESHIGYYLVSDGTPLLYRKVGFRPRFAERVQRLLRSHPDDFLLSGIAILTFAIISGVTWLLTPASTPPEFILLSLLMLLLPGSQAAVQVMNYLTTTLLPVDTLPKVDFSEGLSDDCVTLVAIPTLLLNEKQVHALVENLEVRFLGNHDRNMHFAILSDLPDSNQPASEDDHLVSLCSGLIAELNEIYAGKNKGSFFLLHRHRVYNPRERGWMGWERKRGKLLDLNQLIRNQYDSFPVKVGDVSILPKVRFVITLDSDTELPRGSAHRMVGAMAHPLNQAIIDPERNIVVAGYGILQPRVGVSVQSTARSRLAAIFAGETGLDPYTRAVSDVYQDLYGEGSFTGKGIYEVDALFRVLNRRFPRNSLLSHDLIEGAYARAGLTTDIMVIEDYPSHYSAYNRRKHRWLRGDWQIVAWLTGRVPDETGTRVPNPISLVSRWKILDNLRRSLVEPATFALLLFGWLVMGHPVLWTIATICILFVPAWVEFLFALTRAIIARNLQIARDALRNLLASNFTVLLTLTLLAHQTLLSLDAVVRALVRYVVTRQRLLEWETSAEAELGQRLTPVDRYMDWMPFLAIGLGFVIWLIRPQSLVPSAPILALWACSKFLALWLNASPLEPVTEVLRRDVLFLRKSALHIWRYFAEFSTPEHNWLIPDNIQENPRKVARRVSPTNVGLLLNARQVATEFGYLTVPEEAELTKNTLATVARLSKYRGHLMNWYDTRSLQPQPPFFISSVDSGNLVASLWTLRQGCLDRVGQPLLSRTLADGLLDYLRALVDLQALPKRVFSRCEAQFQREDWLTHVLNFSDDVLDGKNSRAKSDRSPDIAWFREQAVIRVQRVRDLVGTIMPWRLPEFAALEPEWAESASSFDEVPLQQLPDWIAQLESKLDAALPSARNGNASLDERLRLLLPKARQNALRLIENLEQTGVQARDLANAMDFTFLLDQERLLMSVGFDAQSEELQPYCYDLLATEPRIAVFVAIAKEDIPQESWFRLGRRWTLEQDRPVLLSWTGTMFEYLMPSIWMKRYPNTLLDRVSVEAVRVQQAYAASKGIPWGISESACARRNDAGDYYYEAFGVPSLALKKITSDPLVVSPYSTFLALNVEPDGALQNLHRMEDIGWFGSYGFYEAADYSGSRRRFRGPSPELVQSWMVHHLGMSLLSLANFLCDNVVQKWFHADRRVQATELLLQEKPVSHLPNQ